MPRSLGGSASGLLFIVLVGCADPADDVESDALVVRYSIGTFAQRTEHAPHHFVLHPASSQYDFRVDVTKGAGEQPASATLGVSRRSDGGPIGRSIQVADYAPHDAEPSILVGDFDFDGEEDFAVEDGDRGPDSGPSYSVFLFQPAKGEFERSASLSKLTEKSLAFLSVDPARKRLTTLSREGCCTQATSEYAVVRGRPRLMMKETEQWRDGGCTIQTQLRSESARWTRTTRACAGL